MLGRHCIFKAMRASGSERERNCAQNFREISRKSRSHARASSRGYSGKPSAGAGPLRPLLFPGWAGAAPRRARARKNNEKIPPLSGGDL